MAGCNLHFTWKYKQFLGQLIGFLMKNGRQPKSRAKLAPEIDLPEACFALSRMAHHKLREQKYRAGSSTAQAGSVLTVFLFQYHENLTK